MKQLFLSILVCTQFAWGQEIKQPTGSIITPADAQIFLDHHNKVRAAVKVDKLTWSPKLANYAQKGVGHYTQMVWNNTKEVGVGIGYCKTGGIIIVASYFPAGNYVGQYPY